MNHRSRRRLAALALGFCLLAQAPEARADMQREGTWPARESEVSLDLERTPLRVALRRLARAADWSIVLPGDLDELVDIRIKDQPADRVLELLLAQDHFVVHRSGDLLQVRRAAAAPSAPAAPALPSFPALPSLPALPSFPTPPAPPAPPMPSIWGHGRRQPRDARGSDRTVVGGNARVERNQVVRHLTVLGGSVEIEGTVTGDVSVFGGSVRVRRTAHIEGSVRAVGGAARIDDGAQVDGDLEAFGGLLDRGTGDGAASKDRDEGRGVKLQQVASKVGGSLSSSALLFVFGAVLWSLLTGRMERLQVEVASRPMRTFAVGVVGLLVGGLMLVALCITVIGIPVALVAALAAVLGTYAGVCAALQTAGKALLAHRTSNPYVHLALGCFLLFLASHLPWVGEHVVLAVGLLGLGAALTTGAGGLTRPLLGASDSPNYRAT